MFLFFILQYLFSFQRGVRNRKGKPNAEAVWVVCVLSGELSVIHRGINRKGNVWAAALSFSPPVLPILSLSELPVSISTDVFLQFYPHKFSLSPFFPTISLYTVSASSCLWEACEGCVRVHVCVCSVLLGLAECLFWGQQRGANEKALLILTNY